MKDSKKKEIQLFVRFLKDNGICKDFSENYNSNDGKRFRASRFKNGNISKDYTDVPLCKYLENVYSKRFIFEAFDWYYPDEWSKMHDKWGALLRENRKLWKQKK